MHRIIKKSLVAATIAMFPIALVWAQEAPSGQSRGRDLPRQSALPPSVDERFELTHGQQADSVVVGERGSRSTGKREFKFKKNRGPGALDLDLDEKSSGKKNKFSYQEGQAITLEVGGQPLHIAFNGYNVQVGAAQSCVSNNINCITQAIRSQLPSLSSADVAAAYGVLRKDFSNVKHGAQIAKVFEALATQF